MATGGATAFDPQPTDADRRMHSIAVVTFHRCINYGSYWQARSLIECLRDLGHDPRVLDHTCRTFDRLERDCALHPLKPATGEPFDAARYAVKVLRFSRARRRLPLSHPFPLHDPSTIEPTEVVIIGSDEVWNLSHPMYGAQPVFFGDGVPAGRRVSYAASLGNLPDGSGFDAPWIRRLRAFDAISVRDENTRRAIRSAIGRDPEIVLDPCLMRPVEPEGKWRGPRSPFILVYGHSFSTGFARVARAAADRLGLPLLSVGYRNPWAHRQWLGAGPDDFVKAVQRAAAVVTNFFHGCVFALRERKPFAAETSPYRAAKIEGLLHLLGGRDHLVAGDASTRGFALRLSAPPETPITDAIGALRTSSREFLSASIAG